MTRPTTNPVFLRGALARLEGELREAEEQLRSAAQEAARKELAAQEAVSRSLIEPSPTSSEAAASTKVEALAALEAEEAVRQRLGELRRAIATATAQLDAATKSARAQHIAAVRAKLQARKPELERQLHQVVLELAALSKLSGMPGEADFVLHQQPHLNHVFHEVDARIAALVAEEAAHVG